MAAILSSRLMSKVSEIGNNSSGKSGSDNTGPRETSIGLCAGETPGGGGCGDDTRLVTVGPAFSALLCQGGGGGSCLITGAPNAAVKTGGAAAGVPNAAGALAGTGFGLLEDGALMRATRFACGGITCNCPKGCRVLAPCAQLSCWGEVIHLSAACWETTGPTLTGGWPTGMCALAAVKYAST